MYLRVANDTPSSRTDHPERTTRRLCRTPQPTLSSTSAVTGSDRAESTLGSRPPAPRAVDRSTASTAPTHARWQGVQPGTRAVSERASSASALPARPPQFPSEPSSRYPRAAAVADGSSRGDDTVAQGTPFPSYPLSAAVEDDERSYTHRATDCSMEGGARVHPPIITHPRGMEDVRSESRTSPAAYWPGDSRFAFKPATAADDLCAGARGLAVPVAQPRHSTLAEREARVDTLPAWQRADATAPTSRTAVSTAMQRTPSEQMDDVLVYRSGTLQSPLHDAAGPDQISYTRRTLQSVAEGALRLSGAPAGHRCSLSPSVPIAFPDTPRTGHTAQQRSTHEVVRLDSVAVASIAESVGATMRTVYDIGKKYISHFSSNVASVAQDLSRVLSDEQRETAACTASLPPPPRSSAGRPRIWVPVPTATHAPSRAPSSCGVDPIPRTPCVRFGAPHAASTCGNSGAERPDAHMPFNGLSLPPYVVDPHAAGSVPSVAAVALRDDGRSNPRGCDMSYKCQLSPPSAATNNSLKSTSQRTPALEGGAGVLRLKSHPREMEGASTEDALPEYAETSAPGTEDPRFARGVKSSQDAMNVLEKKHRFGARGEDDEKMLLYKASLPIAPLRVHMFSQQSENPAAREVLRGLQSGYEQRRSATNSASQPPPQRQQPAKSNAGLRARRSQLIREADGAGSGSSSTENRSLSRSARLARALRNVKLPMPTYDGRADLQAYEEFVFKWDSWIRNKGLGEGDSVELMYNALTGEALEWYLSFVAMSDHPWTSREIYQELYEYCFPSNFREELRLQLMSSRQDGRPVKRFAKDLQNLAIRFSDVGQSTLKCLLWDGVDPYIRVFWVEKGRSAEYDDYDTLVLYAHRAERRQAEIRRCLDSEGADVETELSPHRENNADGDVTAHAVRMRHVAIRSEDLPTGGDEINPEDQEQEDLEEEPEYYSEEEPEGEREDSQQYNDEYGDGDDEYYYSQDGSEGREHESQEDSQGEYYEYEYEEYGEDEHQPNEYGDGEYLYLDDEEEREGEGDDYYEEEGEDEGEYYNDEAGDEDEEDGHSGEPDLNTGRNEYRQDEYNSEGPLYEDEEEY